MHIQTDGLVINERNVGESDRLITVLTSKYGVIRAFVRGAKSVKSKLLSSTQLLSYSDFVFYKGKDAYSVDSAVAKNVFFELRSDIESLGIAFYLCELFGELAPENDDAQELLRLLLNSLFLLSRGKIDRRQIKSVAELRAMAVSGYMPDLVACEECGAFEAPMMYFSIEYGSLRCNECNGERAGVPISFSTVTAMRHIVFSEPAKIFNFSLGENSVRELSTLTESYAISRTGKYFKTLDFYKSLGALGTPENT